MPTIMHAIDLNGELHCGADRRVAYGTVDFAGVPTDEQCQDCALVLRGFTVGPYVVVVITPDAIREFPGYLTERAAWAFAHAVTSRGDGVRVEYRPTLEPPAEARFCPYCGRRMSHGEAERGICNDCSQ